MSKDVIVNGITYRYPEDGDSNWGKQATNWAVAVSASTLQKTGGSFPLTSPVNFGTTNGIITAQVKSQAPTADGIGFISMGEGEGVTWTGVASNSLTVADGILQYNGQHVSLHSVDGNQVVDADLIMATPGHRIKGDFSNVDLSMRVAFETSVTDASSTIGSLPSGTGTTAAFEAFNAHDPDNSSSIKIESNATEAAISSNKYGTGTDLPIKFYTAGVERLRVGAAGTVSTTGALGVGTTTLGGYQLAVGATGTKRALITSDTSTTYIHSDGNAVVGTTGASSVLGLATSNLLRASYNELGDYSLSTNKNAITLSQITNTDAGAAAGAQHTLSADSGSLYLIKASVAGGSAGVVFNTGGILYVGTTDANKMSLLSNNIERLVVGSNGAITVIQRALNTPGANGASLSFDLSTKNNFSCTPTGPDTITFTNLGVGQSGTIIIANTSGYAIAKGAAVKCEDSFITKISSVGTYRVSYYSDGTYVYVTTSGALL